MKKMARNELLQYIVETILTYDKLEVTKNIIWDYMCDSSKLINWIFNFRERKPIIIAIGKIGIEIGDKEYVSDRLRFLGTAIHTIEITKAEDFISGKDFEIEEC